MNYKKAAVDLDSLPRMPHFTGLLFIAISVVALFTAQFVPMVISIIFACTAAVIITCVNLFYSIKYLSPIMAVISVLLALRGAPSFITLFFFICPVTLLSLCIIRKCSCSQTIIIISVAYILQTLICLLLFASAMPVGDVFNKIYTTFYDSLISFKINSPEGQTFLFSPESAREYIRYFLYLLPAIFTLFFMAISAFTAKFFYLFIKAFAQTEILSEEKWLIRASLPTAIIYTVSYVMSYLFATSYGMEGYYYATQNLMLIFMPALVISGVRISINRLCQNNDSQMLKVMWIIMTIMLFTVATSFTAAIFAFISTVSLMKKFKTSKKL